VNDVAVGLALVLTLVATGCGDDPETSGWTSAPADETAQLVVEQRPITEAEYDRIDDDGEGVLRCPGEGGATWDYGPIGPEDPRGRDPEDALGDAIEDLNDAPGGGSGAELPSAGWVDLVDGDTHWFLLADGEEWQALVNVQGNEELGVWRHNSAILCP
jgi:hypothetical protein